MKPIAPASRSSTISVSSSPFIPTVTVAVKPTGTEAWARACSRSAVMSAAVVDRRRGVGHRDDPAVAAGGGGAGAGLDVLLVLLAGGAQVDVWVEEGREGVQALGVELLGAVRVGLARCGDLGDPAAADHEVVDAVDPGDRVEQRRAAQDEVGGLARRARRAARSGSVRRSCGLADRRRGGFGGGGPSPIAVGRSGCPASSS